jgi:hypothetical protein
MTNSFARSPAAAIGALLAVATIPLHLLFSKMQSEQFAAVLLAVTGAIYVGFGLQKGSLSQILAEVAAAIGFFIGSLAALWVSAWVVPFAFIAHGIWDYAHHEGSKFALQSWKFTVVPRWYPPFCALYDWLAAASLAVMWSLRV